MKKRRFITYEIMTLMFMVLVSCRHDVEKSTSDMLEANAAIGKGVVAKTVDQGCEPKIVLDSVYYYWPEVNSGFQYSVIELISEVDKVLNGYFWGTTDEFEDVREGYYPGFMVLPMQDIEQRGDTLNFVLDSNGHKFYSAPVSIYVHDPVKEHCDTLHAWLQKDNQWWTRVKYTAVFSKNRKELTIIGKSKFEYFQNEPHIFTEYDRDSLAKILPPMPEENDVANRWKTEFSVPKDSIYK